MNAQKKRERLLQPAPGYSQPLADTAKRDAWFEEQHQQVKSDAARRIVRRKMQQFIQTTVSLHIAIIIGLLIGGLIIIARLVFWNVPMTDLDTQNYILYTQVYIGVFVVSAILYLLYAYTNKKRNA